MTTAVTTKKASLNHGVGVSSTMLAVVRLTPFCFSSFILVGMSVAKAYLPSNFYFLLFNIMFNCQNNDYCIFIFFG